MHIMGQWSLIPKSKTPFATYFSGLLQKIKSIKVDL
jgi:hypothetical protein